MVAQQQLPSPRDCSWIKAANDQWIPFGTALHVKHSSNVNARRHTDQPASVPVPHSIAQNFAFMLHLTIDLTVVKNMIK